MYKVRITRTSDWEYEKVTEIKSLDKLFKYKDKYDCNKFVVEFCSPKDKYDIEIEIYDTWRE